MEGPDNRAAPMTPSHLMFLAMQGHELRRLKALSQAVLQQRSDIEQFLLSSLEMVRMPLPNVC